MKKISKNPAIQWSDITLDKVEKWISDISENDGDFSVKEISKLFQSQYEIDFTENDFHEIIRVLVERNKLGFDDFGNFANEIDPKHFNVLSQYFMTECEHPFVNYIKATHAAPNGKRYVVGFVKQNMTICEREITVDHSRKFVGISERRVPIVKFSFDYLDNRWHQKYLRVGAITKNMNEFETGRLWDLVKSTGNITLDEIDETILKDPIFEGCETFGELKKTGFRKLGKIVDGNVEMGKNTFIFLEFKTLTLIKI